MRARAQSRPSHLATGPTLAVAALLVAIGPASGQTMGSPAFSAECTFLLPAAADTSSPTFQATTAVGGLTSGELTSLSFAATFTVLCGSGGGCGTTLCGDCDLNGVVTILDALLGAQHGVALVTLTGVAFVNCDIDNDVDVDVLDSLRLAQFAAGLPVTLTCC